VINCDSKPLALRNHNKYINTKILKDKKAQPIFEEISHSQRSGATNGLRLAAVVSVSVDLKN